MAIFKVGQKVRIVSDDQSYPLNNAEGVIAEDKAMRFTCIWPPIQNRILCEERWIVFVQGQRIACADRHLRPILPERDEAFERFMQSLTELRTLTEHELGMVLGGLAK